MKLSGKGKTFSQFFRAFLKSTLNFKYFEKKDVPQTFSISEITDCENVVTQMSQKSCLTGPFDKQHGKCCQALLKSASQHLYHIHWSLSRKLSWKKSLLLRCQTFVLLVNTLAINEKYPVLNRDNLTVPNQIKLSEKQKTFSEIFTAFLKSMLNFKHFEKKDVLIAFVFPKLPTPKTWLDKFQKVLFQRTLRQATWHTCRSPFGICVTVPLSYSFITAKAIKL